MVPSAVVVAAGNVPAFVLTDIDIADMLATLAPYTTPARFQALLFTRGAAGRARVPQAQARCPTHGVPNEMDLLGDVQVRG